ELLATTKDVENAIKTGTTLIDSRSNDQFLGITKSGSIKRAGTLPGAKNVPGVWLTVNDGGVFRDTESLRRLYKLAGVKTDGPTIMFCNTGHWASIGWFVNSELLGNKETKLYDGSLAEWTLDPKRPVVKAF
ncbi:MAG TPA: sulfurtransferase, partial [Rhodospirillales bacterium]|nr:sulfurtransferase [Rhodospirillales bacterium]